MKGSVKELKILKEPTLTGRGRGRVIFSDRYSVFDSGPMEDKIKGRGAALCMNAAWFFERLAEEGIKTRYRGVVEDGEVKRLPDTGGPVRELEVDVFRKVTPRRKGGGYDYGVYEKEEGNFLLPLEFIYRNSLPRGSSVFRRLQEGNLDISALGLSGPPEGGEKLSRPFLDLSTKMEPIDRYLSWEEAKRMVSLSACEIEEIKSVLKKINSLITGKLAGLGIENCDGKVEMALGENRLPVVADVVGTPDECRFTRGGFPLSKELARIYFRKTPWYKELKGAKKKHGIYFKEHIKTPPPPLPAQLRRLISRIYMAFTNELTSEKYFDVPPLKELVCGASEYI